MVDRLVTSDRLIQVKGSELLWPLLTRAGEAADAAEAFAGEAENGAATAFALTRYFPTRAAGEAGSTVGQAFSAKDGVGNLIAYERTAAGSVEIARQVTPAALAAADGSTRVGFQQSGAGSVPRTMAAKAQEIISANDFGAKGDRVTDDTDAINRAVLAAFLRGGAEVTFGASLAGYRVDGPVLLPSFVSINLAGQTLYGRGVEVFDPMFTTATVENGTLVSNLGSEPESKLVECGKIWNGQIKNAGRAFYFRNYNMRGSLEDLRFINALPGRFERCFYGYYKNIHVSGYTDPATPAFDFDDQTNDVTLLRVSCVVGFGMHISGGSTAVSLFGCSFEGGTRGIKLSDDNLGLLVQGCYFEALPGTAIDFTDAGTCNVNFIGNYIKTVSVVFNDGGPNATLFGTFDASNAAISFGENFTSLQASISGETMTVTSHSGGPLFAGSTISGSGVAPGTRVVARLTGDGGIGTYTIAPAQTVGSRPMFVAYRGEMIVSGARNFIDFRIPGTNDTDLVVPANWTVSKSSRISFDVGHSGDNLLDIRAMSRVHAGVVPLLRSGDVGDPIIGRVNGQTIAVPTGASVAAAFTTKIRYRANSLRATFVLRVQDNAGIYKLGGDIYGDVVKQADGSDKVVTLSEDSGFVRLSIAGLNNSNGSATVTGSVQLA